MRKRIEKCIDYSHILDSGCDAQLADEILDCLVHVFSTRKTDYMIDGEKIPIEKIRATIIGNLCEEKFRLIMTNIQQNGSRTIHNMKNYIMVCFYRQSFMPETTKEEQKVRAGNSFNRFEQNNYDFELLEKELLNCQCQMDMVK